MKTLTGITLVVAFAIGAVAAGAGQVPVGPEQALVTLENDWSQASIKRDGATLQQFYADEYVFTDADGMTSTKAKEIANLTSGAFRLTAYKFEDVKVRVYGEVAVVTGRNTIKGTWEDIERDISGPYRFTDVFVRRNGRWQCIASQSSRITEK